jgi:hypothetical protein
VHGGAGGQVRTIDTVALIVDNQRIDESEREQHLAGRNMRNNLNRVAHWITFILERCQFPNLDALAAQFSNAEIGKLCECGCNSFALSMAAPDEVPRIATAMSGQAYRRVFEADFRDLWEPEGWGSLEIMLFANESGHLADVEIDYCGNGIPIPEHLNLELTPYNVFISEKLIRA